MSECVHKGNLHVLATGVGNEQQWQQRFYVLHKVTPNEAARLDCYPDERAFKIYQPPQKTYSINDVSKIKDSMKPGHSAKHKFTFEIVYSFQKKEILFSTQSLEEMTQWTTALKASMWEQDQANRASFTRDDEENVSLQNTLYESVETISELTYSVQVDKTEASTRCNIPQNKMYQLHICQNQLSLVNPETGTTVSEWPYKLIRRYGRSTSQFSFEAGRRCNSGAGLFNFRTAMADKLFSDVRNRTMAMRENQHDGDSGEIIVDDHRKPSTSPFSTPRQAANAKPATAKPVAASHVPPKRTTTKPAPVAAPRIPTGSKPVLAKTESGNVMEKVKTFQDNTAGIPIAMQKVPLSGQLSGGKDKEAHVLSKSDKEKLKKDMSKLHKEMSAKSEQTKQHTKAAKDAVTSKVSEAKDAVSSKVSESIMHQKKMDAAPPAKPPDQKDSSRGVPNQLRARGLPSLPKAPPEADSVEYDVAYSPPNDSEYSETYAEISQGSCVVNAASDSSDSYTYAAVGPAARTDMKMSSVVADMSRSRSRRPVPAAAVATGGSGDVYDYLDFDGVTKALPKDTGESSGNIYGHLSVAVTEDDDGYADPVFLKETRAHKNGKK